VYAMSGIDLYVMRCMPTFDHRRIDTIISLFCKRTYKRRHNAFCIYSQYVSIYTLMYT